MSESIDEISSLVSVPITVCNVPDPLGVEADFVYNFYVEDEDRSYSPLSVSPIDYSLGLIDKTTVDSIEQRERGSLQRRVPRYIRVRIQTNTLGISQTSEAQLSGLLTSDDINSLKNTKISSTVYSIESSVENEYIAKKLVGDAAIKSRLQKTIYRVAASMLGGESVNGEKSDFQIAEQLNKLMSDEIDAASIVDALADNEIKGVRFANEVSGKRFNRLDDKSSLTYPTKINASSYRELTTLQVKSNPFSGDFLSDLLGASENPLLSEATFPKPDINNIESLQPQIKRISPKAESLEDVRDTDILKTANSREDIESSGLPSISHIGYVVEKTGESPDGSLESFDDFISLNPNISEFIDPLVKYGHTYYYKARQLYLVEFSQVVDIVGEQIKYVIVKAIIASTAPKPAAIQAVELDPPIAPGTLICSFIYKEGNGIRLDWARPSNPTRDIKKYQVFRRPSIQAPFEIIAEYDFTDEGYTQFDQREFIDPHLVHRVSYPKYSHTDIDFSRESSYIYSVVAVDAHGLTSNYGTQIEAKFNRFTNKLQTRVVSKAGAPKAYPNYFVDPTELEEFGTDRLIEDVIKDSGHGRMRVYFNPDAYKVTSEDSSELTEPLVLSSQSGSYKFQIVNLDRQISRNLTINIAPDTALSYLM